MNTATNALAPSKAVLPQRPLRRLAASCVAVLTLVATAMPLPAYARSAPESFADLAEEVTPAVDHRAPSRRAGSSTGTPAVHRPPVRGPHRPAREEQVHPVVLRPRPRRRPPGDRPVGGRRDHRPLRRREPFTVRVGGPHRPQPMSRHVSAHQS